MNRYRLTHYDHRKREVAIEVDDLDARTVVLAYWRARYPKSSRPASLTRRHQRDSDPAVRDNAHLQADRGGHVGWYAERVDAAARTAELNALSPAQYLDYLKSCPPAAGCER